MSAQRKSLSVHPPLAGVIRRTGFQLQAPYSSYRSRNYLPFDARTFRQLSATRPPLEAFQTPGTPVNLLCRVNDPAPSLVAAVAGKLYRYKNGWLEITSAETIAEERPVFATPYVRQVFIANGGTPLVYDSADNTLVAMTASAGTLPNDPRMVIAWQGSLMWAGDPDAPHVFTLSRTGDPLDYDASVTDAGGAFAGTGDNEGMIGEPVTALVSHTADTAVIAGEHTLWALRGHPRRGGSLELASSKVGILGQGAWTKGPGDELYFLSKAGLAAWLPNPGAIPTPLSKERIPSELVGSPFDPTNPTVNMSYDPWCNGIWITVRGARQQAWYYDLDNGGFHEQEYADYPMVMQQFDLIQSDEASGVLFGGSGYGGLARHDIRGTETVANKPELIIGPMRISSVPTHKSKVMEARHILGLEMYAGAGEINLHTAATGQRVVDDTLAGDSVASYARTTDSVIANGGNTHPLISGHALTIQLKADTQLANPTIYEGTELYLQPAGRIKVLPSGEPSAFPTPASGYAWAIPSLPFQTQTDYTFFVDLARLPASWWALPQADGDDIRPALSDDTLLPFDLVSFNKSAKTGFLAFKRTQNLSPQHIRIWAGDASATAPNPGDAIGRHNAYDSNWIAFYPLGGGDDRTANGYDLTMTGSPSVGGTDGPIGNAGTQYNGTSQFGQVVGITGEALPTTLTGWFRRDSTTGDKSVGGCAYTNAGGTDSLADSLRCRILSSQTVRAEVVVAAGASAATTGNTWGVGSYHHFANRFRTTSDRRAFLNGNIGQVGIETTTRAPAANPDAIVVGAEARLTPASEFFDGSISLFGVHTNDRSNEFIRYQASMRDQFNFWGDWRFVEAAWPF